MKLKFFTLAALFFTGCASLHPSSDAVDSRPGGVSKERQDLATERVIDGALYDVKEDRARAILEYEDALQFDDSPGIHALISKDYTLLGKLNSALRHARTAVEMAPSNTEYRQNLADIYLAAHDLDSALIQYRQVLRGDSSDVSVMYTIGRIYQQQQKFPEALEVYRTISEEFGANWQALIQMASVYEFLKQFDSAAVVYHQMLGIDPSNTELKKRLAGTFLQAEKPDSALAILNELHAVDSSDVEINLTRGNAFLQKKEWERAYAIFLPIIKRDSITVEAALSLGIEFLRAGADSSGAMRYAQGIGQTVRDRFPSQWQPYVFLGDVEVSMHSDSTAIANYEKAISLNNRIVEPYIQLGLMYFQKNENGRAVEILERAHNNFPDDFRVLLYLGIGYSQSGRTADAVPLLSRAVEMQPKNVDAIGALAQALDGMKRFSESDSLYERALTLDPKNHLLLNNFSYSLAERGLRLKDALKMSTAAVEIDSSNSAYLDTLGWIYFKLDDFASALRYIKRAIDLRQQAGGSEAVLYEHLGDVYHAEGSREKAVDAWKKALEMDKNNDSLREKVQREEE